MHHNMIYPQISGTASKGGAALFYVKKKLTREVSRLMMLSDTTGAHTESVFW